MHFVSGTRVGPGDADDDMTIYQQVMRNRRGSSMVLFLGSDVNWGKRRQATFIHSKGFMSGNWEKGQDSRPRIKSV